MVTDTADRYYKLIIGWKRNKLCGYKICCSGAFGVLCRRYRYSKQAQWCSFTAMRLFI